MHGALILNGKRIAMNDEPAFVIRSVLKEQFRNGIPMIKSLILDNKYGYVLIPGNNAFGESSSHLAQQIQDSLFKLNLKKLSGLIIDLRLNTGGTMFPMLCGLNQIIGDGTVGSFVDLEGRPVMKWIIKGETFSLNTQRIAAVRKPNSIPKNFKIVVLMSQITMSSGEDVAVAFKGRANTLFVGEKTGGFTTSTSIHYVDGQLLTVSNAFVADRTGRVYYEGISPDIYIIEGDDFENLLRDKKVIAALNWLKSD